MCSMILFILKIFCNSIEYVSFLKDLAPPLPDPKKCKVPYHCDSRPQCFTDFKPHYAKNLTLTELVVGQSKWVYDDGNIYFSVAVIIR